MQKYLDRNRAAWNRLADGGSQFAHVATDDVGVVRVADRDPDVVANGLLRHPVEADQRDQRDRTIDEVHLLSERGRSQPWARG